MTSSLLFNVTTLSYMVSMLIFFGFLATKNRTVGLAASGVAYFGFLVQTVAIILRWKESYDDGGRPCAPLQPVRVGGLFLLDDHSDLRDNRVQVQVPGRRRIRRPLCPARDGLGTARSRQRHRAAGPGSPEQLAALPRHHLFSRLRGFCSGLRHLHHVPDQGEAGRAIRRYVGWRGHRHSSLPSRCSTT